VPSGYCQFTSNSYFEWFMTIHIMDYHLFLFFWNSIVIKCALLKMINACALMGIVWTNLERVDMGNMRLVFRENFPKIDN